MEGRKREEARGFFYSSIFLFLFGRCCVAVAPKKRQFHGAPGIEMKQKKIFFIISDPDMLIRNHLWGIKRQQSSSKIRETIIPKWNFWVVEKAFFFSFHIFHLFLWGKNRREASAGGGPPLPPLQKLAIHKRTHRSLKKKMEKKKEVGGGIPNFRVSHHSGDIVGTERSERDHNHISFFTREEKYIHSFPLFFVT